MHPSALALVAMMLFAIENTLIARFLGHVNTLTNMLVMNVTIIVAIVAMMTVGANPEPDIPFTLPQDRKWWLIIISVGLIFAVADFFYLKALKAGSVTEVTMIACLLPVMAAIVSNCFERWVPTWDHVVSWLLAVGSVAFVTFKPLSGAPAE